MTETLDVARSTQAEGVVTVPTVATLDVATDATLRTPIDEFLRVQGQLTPVERFARAHDSDQVPAGERWWRDRLPVEAPGPGQQYAFEVELDACSGCKACVTACHSLNGLDEGEAWRRVGSLHGEGPTGPIVQTVTAACHHCIDPGCLAGCPVDAYEKDPVTGIVSHLDDQCIGCSYCTLTCPYEVPVYNRDLGIVRKCDLCRGRLAEGEAPACVQGCPNGAIRVALVDVEQLRRDLRPSDEEAGGVAASAATLVPGAPKSSLTLPTTRYLSRRRLPDSLTAADQHSVSPGAAHPPLAVMLVLTQLAVGAFVIGELVDRFASNVSRWLPAFALATGLLAMGAAVLHLGRPLLAWRAVIGLRHSWLSREIVAFGAFGGLAAAHSSLAAIGAPAALLTAAAAATGLAGLAGVVCSIALYVVTGRLWWRTRTTTIRFGATSVVCGGLTVALALVASAKGPTLPAATAALLLTVAGVAAVNLAVQGSWQRHRTPDTGELADTAALLRGPLAGRWAWRFALGIAGGIAGPLLVLATGTAAGAPRIAPLVIAAIALVLATLGELMERHLFFTASVPPRMPGIL